MTHQEKAWGGTLLQEQGDEWVVIGYHSKRLPKSAKNFGVTELQLTELLVNIHGFMQLLRNRNFEVLVDQNCIRAEALNYIVINHFLFRIDTQKDKDLDKGSSFLLVIPEKYEPIIFNTYHDSLLAGHQGPYHTAMTIRQKFFIHNLMNKVKRYIEACHTCLKTKPKYMKNRPTYGRIPVDYAPMQDLSIDIKMMPQAFGGYHLLLVITCDQTNFTIAVPLRDRTAQTVAEALIYRDIYLFRPPRQIISDEAMEFSSAIIQTILCMLNCRFKVISPYNHGSSKCERQI